MIAGHLVRLRNGAATPARNVHTDAGMLHAEIPRWTYRLVGAGPRPEAIRLLDGWDRRSWPLDRVAAIVDSNTVIPENEHAARPLAVAA